MAAVVSMQPSRTSMDRTPSFEQPRPRSTPPFASTYDAAPSPIHRPHSHSSSINPNLHTSPYHQTFRNNYFQTQQPMYTQQSWTAQPLPASAFYNAPYQNSVYQGQVFPQGFQQSQADIQAWANTYQHMFMASMAHGHGHGQQGGVTPPIREDERRRTSPVPQQGQGQGFYDQRQPQQVERTQLQPTHHAKPPQQPQSFHPYKRAPSQKPSNDNMSRSASQPNLAAVLDGRSPSSSISSTRTPSVAPPSRASSQDEVKRDSFYSDRVSSQTTRTASPATISSGKSSAAPTIRAVSQPLHTGPIANATNSLLPTTRSSPLSRSVAPSPEPAEKVKTSGLKSRLKKALDKDKMAKMSTPPPPSPAKPSANSAKSAFTSPSEASTRSATPPTTPHQDLPPPSAPFVMHRAAMNSDVSIAETERTTMAPSELGEKKGKKSLFRMKNMSTDNISLASTVSSASMMIRKMGSIGKLARRNSLMCISKIFKDKPKDEDAGLPEKEGKKKKEKKSKKGKAEPAAAAVTHAIAESEVVNEEEDRALAGLSPAAKLARQHTLRSKAEQAKKEESQAQAYPSIGAVAGAPTGSAPEVLHVQPRQTPTVVHAVAVNDHEYDSDDDSSEGETVEDLTATLGKVRLSLEADAEFQQTWGRAFIDRFAVPKKGILKATSFADITQGQGSRRRAESEAMPHFGPGRMSQIPTNPNEIDGLAHPAPVLAIPNDPFSAAMASFDSPSTMSEHGLYSQPSHNTSAPTLTLVGQKPIASRSMTAPARKKLFWAPECAVYSTYDAGTYDRRSEPATCNRLTPELALSIKQELNAFKLEMPVHPESRVHTHYFA